MLTSHPRRKFITTSIAATAGLSLLPRHAEALDTAKTPAQKMQLGLVTYLWGKDMDLPTLLDVCEKSGVMGVELRTQHAHGVEPVLSKAQRAEVKKRFADSPVELVGYGSNAQYHENNPAKVKANIALTKEYIRLMHDCGGSGVKVKPNGFAKDVPREKPSRKSVWLLMKLPNLVMRWDNRFELRFTVAAQANFLSSATSSRSQQTPTQPSAGIQTMLTCKVAGSQKTLTWSKTDSVIRSTSVN